MIHFKHTFRNSTLLIISVVMLTVATALLIFFQNHYQKKSEELLRQEKHQAAVLKHALKSIDPKRSNIIYPKKLKTPKASADYVSKSRFTLSWKAVPYADTYVIYRYIPALEKYCPVKKCRGTSSELTRNRGIYSVRAYAYTGRKYIRSSFSRHLTIRAACKSSAKYSSVKKLISLNSSNLVRISTVTGFRSATDPQSMCFSGKKYILCYVNKKGSHGYLAEYTRGGRMITYASEGNMGFANGSTCNPYTGKIYVVKTHRRIKSRECSTYRLSDLSPAGSFTLPREASGIAYDESTNRYCLSNGAHIYVCDSSFHVLKDIRKKRWHHTQDIGAYNGAVICCSWISGSESYIDIYRISDGAYLGGYDIHLGEIESAFVDDGYLIILMNTVGSRNDRIYRTKERIGL